jgi:membrane protein DedA with SNARE-associated domain/membrane-associated phospholipid phosphatase
MTDIVSPLLQWLNANPQWAGLVIFAISAGESAPIFGTIVPGSITMTAFGALAGAGVIPLWSSLVWAILGAIVGDGIGYWIGYHFKDRLHYVWPFKNNPEILQKGEVFFTKYGGMSVFIGRFIGPVRALVPIVAGMFGMKPWHFLFANVTSAIGWAPAYMLPGILLGAVSLELPPEIALHVILVLFILILFTLLCLWFIYKLAMLIKTRVLQLQDWIWQHLKKRPYLSPITFLLKHHDPAQSHGQLNLAILIVLTSGLLFLLLIYVHLISANHIMINDAIYHFFRGIRTNEIADNIMLNVTLLGQKQVVLFVFLALFAWLVLQKRWRAAWHTLALGVLAAGSIYVLKHLVQSERPWGIINAETYSMPSGHTTLATVMFMGLAFLGANSVKEHFRFIFYSLAGLIAFAVGLSRLYLGAHWFTDIISAWLLSTVLLMIVILSYQRKEETPIRFRGIFTVSLGALIIMFSFIHYQYFDQIKIRYSQIELPPVETTMKNWWQNRDKSPVNHTSLFGFPSQEINIEWVGDLEKIRASLNKQGWRRPPVRDIISTIHRVADISSTQFLPMVSPQYLDKKPALILIRQENKKTTLVLRLWHTNVALTDSPLLWVGTVGVVPRSYSWLFKDRYVEIQLSPKIIFTDKTSIPWEWKMIQLSESNSHQNKKIILIRKK